MNETPPGTSFTGEEEKTEPKHSEVASEKKPEMASVPVPVLVPAPAAGVENGVTPTTGEQPGAGELNKGAKAGNDDPPVDWFEPLEDDDDTHNWALTRPGKHASRRNEEEEEGSVAGESEKSGSVASEEKVFKRIYRFAHCHKNTNADEGWVDWPILGEGWKRRQVIRRSGSSVGQRDVYYVGPHGERIRSKVELSAVLGSVMDVAMFDFKTGAFHEGQPQPPRRKRRKTREHLSSESSYVEKDEGADTPEPCPMVSPQRRIKKEPCSREDPTPSVKPNTWSPKATLTCARCGVPFVGTSYDRQRKRPRCPSCWSAKRKTHPSVRTKKSMPCGQCQACLKTSNCGSCLNCKDKLNALPNSFSWLTCQKRRCLYPIRKEPNPESLPDKLSPPPPPLPPPPPIALTYPEDFQEPLDGNDVQYGFEMDVTDQIMESSETEPSVNIGLDDEEEDMSDDEGDYDDDDEDWPRKRRRRACGTCDACLSTKDCGACDFCIDKPKFGGRNTKRQKCRLRQCRRQAKLGPGHVRRKPRYTYSRKPLAKRSKGLPSGGHGGRGEDDTGRSKAMNWSPEPASSSKRPPEVSHRTHRIPLQVNKLQRRDHGDRAHSQTHINTWRGGSLTSALDSNLRTSGGRRAITERDGEGVEDNDTPAITEIFSLAESQSRRTVDVTTPLYKLLEDLRDSALPILWYAILVAGPRLQIIQCAKQSRMADTAVLIEPDFGYRVTVQKQPLLPTHLLYEQQPVRMSCVTQVVKLLLDLEGYAVCQGIPMEQMPACDGPIILERALTCDFLVEGNVEVCASCRALCGQSED